MLIEVKFKLDDGTEITLSTEDAEKLYDELHKIYGQKNQINLWPTIMRDREPYQPRPYWESPIISGGYAHGSSESSEAKVAKVESVCLTRSA